MLTKIEEHLATCNQCFRWAMLRWYDVPDDHGACLAGRKLLPMLPRNGVALVLPSPETDVEYEVRCKAQVAR